MSRGPVAFVSGASRGIGLALVQRLLRDGAAVAASARHATHTPALESLVQQHGPEQLQLLDMDVTDERSIQAAAAAVDAPCSLLVHSAALMHPSGKGENSVRRLEHSAISEVLSTNVVGPALLTGALYPQLRAAAKSGGSSTVLAVGAGVGDCSSLPTDLPSYLPMQRLVRRSACLQFCLCACVCVPEMCALHAARRRSMARHCMPLPRCLAGLLCCAMTRAATRGSAGHRLDRWEPTLRGAGTRTGCPRRH
jgi:hypothetical protein